MRETREQHRKGAVLSFSVPSLKRREKEDFSGLLLRWEFGTNIGYRLTRFLLVLQNVAALEEDALACCLPLLILAQEPLKIHGEVQHFLLLRIGHNLFGGLILLNRHSLLVPVDSIGLLNH